MIEGPGRLIEKSLFVATQKFYKNGIEIEKGALITAKRIEDNRQLYEYYCNLWTAYPDLFLDLIASESEKIELYFYQRIFLRACMRFRYHYCTAPRAFSKTFLSLLALFLKCMFQPRSKIFICAPAKSQAAKVAKEKIVEIYRYWPVLRREIVGCELSDTPGNFGKDYVQLTFRNQSVLDVVGALETTRGGRRHAGLIDETRDQNGDDINEIVLPLLNVDRRMANGQVNPYEPHKAQFYMTSASQKSTYAYGRMIELFEQEIISPESTFVWGCDVNVPKRHGLISQQFINELKMSATFKEESFGREYMSIWSGGSDESWFNYDKMSRHRKLVNPELQEKLIAGNKIFYLLAVDVGRLSCQTVVTVYKVFESPEGYRTNIVNIVVLGILEKDRHFEKQALDLKKLIKAYQPREVVIDGNGLGVGLLDFMVKPQMDLDGEVYPPYGCFNDDSYKHIQPKDCKWIIYVIKANSTLNSKIHSNCYSWIHSGKVTFLIKEQEAKNKLMSTKVGQKMSVVERAKRLMPHEMTTKLFEEMANLRIKPTGNALDVNLEQINTRFGKDKFSSFEYGLWRLKELEEQYIKNRSRHTGKRKLTFFTEGG